MHAAYSHWNRTSKYLMGLGVIVLLLFACVPLFSQSQKHGVAKALGEMKFVEDTDVKCLTTELENGDPEKGPSTFILKAPSGCVVDWHYHTAEEQMIVVQGDVMTEMPDMPAKSLGPASFAMMPGKVPHRFTCNSKSGCIMYVTFDRTYDISWGKNVSGAK